MRLDGSAGPSSTAGIPPKAATNGPTNGMEPPDAHQHRLGAEAVSERGARGDERGTVGLGLPGRGSPVRHDLELEAPRDPALEVGAQLLDHPLRFLTGGQAQAQAGGRRRDDLIRRTRDGMRVEADHRERRPHPEAFER